MLVTGSETWIEKMNRWLPFHQDEFFACMQAAANGAYKPSFKPDPDSDPDPVTVRAAANRALDEFSARADMAMRRRRQKGR